jgi:membrane-associated phospholipid phosphatase
MSTSSPASARISRLWPLVSAGAVLVLALGLGLLIFYREQDKPFGFELEWMGEIVEHRSPVWTVPSLFFNAIGGGILAITVIPLLVIAALLLWRRPWSALYFAISIASTALVVQLLKGAFGRPRPTDILITSDFGSFPSGHSANAAVMATGFGILFVRAWVWAAGGVYTLAMMLSRTYLGAHWISDTIGGMLLGVGVAIIIWAPLASCLHRERMAGHAPVWRHASL